MVYTCYSCYTMEYPTYHLNQVRAIRHTRVKASACTKKIQLIGTIFHGIPLESVPHKTRICYIPSKGELLWCDLDQDQWCKITQIMIHQTNQWINSGHGFIDSFDAPWSRWSWITDPDSDHPKGTHSKIGSLLSVLTWRHDSHIGLSKQFR